jgi:hypothetical protein
MLYRNYLRISRNDAYVCNKTNGEKVTFIAEWRRWCCQCHSKYTDCLITDWLNNWLTVWVTDQRATCMEHSPFWATNIPSATHEIPRYRGHKSQQISRILNQISPSLCPPHPISLTTILVLSYLLHVYTFQVVSFPQDFQIKTFNVHGKHSTIFLILLS